MTDSRQSDPHAVPLHEIYLEELRTHAVELIRMGYARIPSASFALTEEDDITDKLVQAMRDVKNDSESPEWADFYEVHEQRPQNVAGKSGKRRPKMDIEFERNERGRRPRLGFEAKRLGGRHASNGYLGEEGLAAFLAGYYPTSHGEAGMLGYIQKNSVRSWSEKLSTELTRDSELHRFVDWYDKTQFDATARVSHFDSQHTTRTGDPLRMIHLLLAFY
jgi:hypothetical protein